MSRDWTPEELAAASSVMKAAGNMSYEEFRAAPKLTSVTQCWRATPASAAASL